MKIIAFCGAQSTGKTTLLNKLSEVNYKESYVKFVPEVTRLISREYKLPINEDGNGLTQLLINASHVDNIFFREPIHIETKVLDRCVIDGYIYTEYLNESQAKRDPLLVSVAKMSFQLCYDLLKEYSVIFYTSPVGVKLERDGERSSNVNFRNDIIKKFDTYIQTAISLGANIVTLEGSVEERLETIKAEVDRLNIKLKVSELR